MTRKEKIGIALWQYVKAIIGAGEVKSWHEKYHNSPLFKKTVDAIYYTPIDVPSDEEINKWGHDYVPQASFLPDILNAYVDGAMKVKDEIIKRNKT